MTQATAKTSAIVVAAPHRLTNEQRADIAGVIAAQLPADVGVIVLDHGFTVQAEPVVLGTVDLGQCEARADKRELMRILEKINANQVALLELLGRVTAGGHGMVAA